MLFFITLFLFIISIIACIFVLYIRNKYGYDNKLKGFKNFVWSHSEKLTCIIGGLITFFGLVLIIMTTALS